MENGPELSLRAPGTVGEHFANALAAAASAASVAFFVLTHGVYGIAGHPAWRVLLAGCVAGFLTEAALRWRAAGWRRRFFRDQWAEGLPALALPPALLAVLLLAPGHVLIAAEAYLGAALLAQAGHVYHAAHRSNLGPAQVLVLSWLTVVAAGTALLSLPRATASAAPAPFTTALFTATSALCVTGLTVEDTGTYWSRGGQLVILALIQVGGLGLMTLAAFFTLVLGRGLALRERLVLREMFQEASIPGVSRLTATIFALTAGAELLGALLLYDLWEGPSLTVGERVFYSVFHSISAFCNAGFSLHATSFIEYADRWQITTVVPGLIILGGLGFGVLASVRRTAWGMVRRWAGRTRSAPPRLTLHAALVLSATAALLVGGTALALLLEGGGVLRGTSAAGDLRRAWFLAVTSRTAGFNTVDTAALSLPMTCVVMGLMFVGASPGSTGGGVKTSTMAVLLGNLWATLCRRERVEALHRTVPVETVRRATAVVTLCAMTVGLTVLGLAVTEGERFRFEDLCFEAVSAIGTVGLSRGITGLLSEAGRVVITVGMFLGRIGPLTLALALSGQARTRHFEYAEEGVLIG
jgi:trk system potassium uptake protein TrkH